MRMKMRKSVLSTACVTVQQQTSSKQGGTSVFSILKCFLLSETMTEVSSTGSPQTTGRPTQCSPQSVLPYFLAVNTMRLDPPHLLIPSCLLGAKLLHSGTILLHFPPQISLSGRISAHPQSLSPSFSLKNVLSDWRLTKIW